MPEEQTVAEKPAPAAKQEWTRREAWAAVGVTAVLGGVMIGVPFIGLFTVAMMAVPVTFDIMKNGKNNILTRAWNDLRPALDIVGADIGTFCRRVQADTMKLFRRGKTAETPEAAAPQAPAASGRLAALFRRRKPAADFAAKAAPEQPAPAPEQPPAPAAKPPAPESK